MNKILYNAIKCPDGTILHSKHCHDYQEHTDTTTGEWYMVDGGNDYRRMSTTEGYTDLLVTTDSPHEKIREVFTWSSCLDAAGNRLPAYVTKYLKDLDDNHVKALVKYTKEGYPEYINKIMRDEFSFRGLVWDWNELEG